MKYIKCFNYFNELSFINVDKIVNITKTLGGDITIVTVNNDEKAYYTDYESLKNPIEFEKISEII
jgi:superoxide dismutase